MSIFNFVLLVAILSSFSASVPVSSNVIDTINDLLHHQQPAVVVCRPLNYADDIVPGTAKQTISINNPYGAFANGNDVYIAGFSSGNVFRFNSEQGGGIQAVETNNIGGNPSRIDVKDDFVYVTNYATNAVYRKPLVGGQYTQILTVNDAYAISWSPDGERLLVSEANRRTVHVFDKDLQEITTFAACADPRKLIFNLDGNIVSSYSNGLCIHDKDNYSLLSQVVVPNDVGGQGFIQHCDGTLILADATNGLHFLDKDYNTLKWNSGFGPSDVALTDDGTLYVTDFGASRVYLFSIYSDEEQSNE